MTTNEKFVRMLVKRRLDTRLDVRRNRDIRHIAEILRVSPIAVVNWLAPPHWKTHRKMRQGYLALLEKLAGQEAR